MSAASKLEALAKARAARAKKQAEGTLEVLDPLERVARTPKSLDLAIKAMCYECVGRDEPGGSNDIALCSCWDCPLWQFRPHQSRASTGFGATQHAAHRAAATECDVKPLANAARDPKSRRKAISAKCAQCLGVRQAAQARSCTAVFPREQFGLSSPGGWRGCPLWPHRPGADRDRRDDSES